MHPVLKPGLGRVWRDERTLQLGLDPSRSLLLTCDGPATSRLLAALDGVRDRGQVIAHARHLRIPAVEAGGILDALAARGVLEDARSARRVLLGLHPIERRRLQPDLAALSLTSGETDGGARAMSARRTASVLVDGLGRLGAVIATLLAAAGIGRLLLRDPATATEADAAPGGIAPADAGRPRAEAVRDAARALTSSAVVCEVAASPRRSPTATSPPATSPPGPAPSTAATSAAAPDVAVVVGDGDAERAVRLGERLVADGVPHVHAEVVEALGRVGPFVVPGVTSCVRCHQLHRAERDPRGRPPPRGHPQLPSSGSVRAPVAACDSVLAVAVAAQTVFQVLAHLDGRRPEAVDGTLEMTLATGRSRRRSWQPHPACGCRAAGPGRARA